MSNSVGMVRSIKSLVSFMAPSFARRSLPSLPSIPSCPLTHLKVVGAVHLLRMWAAFWKSGAFFMPIHPLSSHVPRCVVSPLMAYIESVDISRGWNGGVAFIAVMIATISPVWFECVSPGTFMALFRPSSGPNHIPLPLRAFSLPLLKHAPSVKMVCCGCQSCVPGSWCLLAGLFDILSGLVKILKHSARLFLHVIDGSKVMASFVIWAILLCSFLVLVRERFPW